MDGKISFTEQIRIALSKPLWYKTLFQQSIGKHILYFLALIVLITVIQFVIPVTAYLQSVGGLQNLIFVGLPSFSLENGELTMDRSIDMERNGVRLVIDTDVDNYTLEDARDMAREMDGELPIVYLISKNNLVSNVNGVNLPLKDLGPMSMNNQILYQIAPVYLFIYGGMNFLYQIVAYLFSALFFALFGYLLNKALGLNLKFGQVYVIALYAKSFQILLESILRVVGLSFLYYLGSIVGIFITCNYMTRGMTSLVMKPKGNTGDDGSNSGFFV